MKLTKPQQSMLDRAAADPEGKARAGLGPAQRTARKLEELGLGTTRFVGSLIFTINDTGRRQARGHRGRGQPAAQLAHAGRAEVPPARRDRGALMLRYDENGWPILTAERAAELLDRVPDGERLVELASKFTIYPGGGAPAHQLRTAASMVDEARKFLADHVDRGQS